MKSPTVRKQLFKKFMDEYSKELIENVTDIYACYSTKEKANRLQEEILEGLAKMLILYRRKVVDKKNLVPLRRSFRLICSSITNSFRYYSSKTKKKQRDIP